MDYYSILGVPRNASQDDIRKAYKKKSMQHHPDRPDGSEEQFKRINEAYSTLSDPQKRQHYDTPQPRFDSRSFNNHSGFDDLFSQMFNSQRRAPRNQDVKIRVSITLKEVFTGKKLLAAYRLRNGSEETVNLDIPPGVRNGDSIKFEQLGDNAFPGPRGNLYVGIKIIDDKDWQRNDSDLTKNIQISCFDLILGTKYVIHTLDDKTLELNIPPGTKNNTTFSMHGYGLPNVRTRKKGNLFIKIDALIPQNLNKEQIEKIKEISDGLKTS